MSVSVVELPSIGPIDQREAYYDTLFQGELPYEPLPDDGQIGIAALCRATHRAGRRADVLRNHVNNLPSIVDAILVEHDLAAKSGDGDHDAVFAFADEETRDLVGDIVTDIFTQWEVTHNKNKLDPLLPDAHSSSKGLVIETAAAVMSIAATGNGFNLRKNKLDRGGIARIIYNWGPEFARQWFNGTIIRQWAEGQQLSTAETDTWLEVFTPSILKHFTINSTTDPLEHLEAVKYHLEETLTDTNIAERLGWTPDEVAEVFTPSMRKHFAVGNISDPLKALEAVKLHLEETLTDTSIAERLGWTQAEVAESFTPSIRKYFTLINRTDPLGHLEAVKLHLEETLTDTSIAERLGWTPDEVAEVFTPSSRRHFAVRNVLDPLKACQDWIDGRISMGKTVDASRDRKLEKLSL